ncbi:histamine receptor H2 [Chelydra serpentina]|uniref:Histamine receptor H2 n=1 Tax=Chelydra serpentina TaxID=8475 RepID=A0A8T1TJ87_CHESE|nr:histamine receptor H2 [Chelydra serpentina]
MFGGWAAGAQEAAIDEACPKLPVTSFGARLPPSDTIGIRLDPITTQTPGPLEDLAPPGRSSQHQAFPGSPASPPPSPHELYNCQAPRRGGSMLRMGTRFPFLLLLLASVPAARSRGCCGAPRPAGQAPPGGAPREPPPEAGPGAPQSRGPGPAGGCCGSRRLKIGIICALGALVMLSNGAVIAVIASAVAGWSRSSRLTLLSLAAADAALALLVVPLNVYGSLARAQPEAYCRAVAFVNSSVFGAALYSLAGVSLERYVAVFFPLRHARLLGRRRLALLLAAAWLGPALLLLPVALPGRAAVLRVRFSAAALLCEPDYGSNAAYAGLLAAAIFCPAAATVTFANLRLWQAARAQRRRGDGAGPPGKGAGLRRLRLLQLHAASRVLVPVVVAFYVCWAPCIATILYNAITKDRVHEWLEFVALWLPSGSGFLNCFVYFWTNRNFRHKFQKIGHKLCAPCSRAKWEQDVHRMVTISAVVERSSSQPALFPDRSCSGSSTSTLLPREAQTSL